MNNLVSEKTHLLALSIPKIMRQIKDVSLLELPDYPALQQLGRALWRNGSIRGAALLVGAGFSKNAILAGEDSAKPPLWADLNNALVSELYPGAPHEAPTNALRIAEEYRTYFGQAALDDFIRKRFPDLAWSPGPLHASLLSLPWADILTTNWDTLLERASSESLDNTYDPVRSESDLPHARAPRIVKLHGTIGDPGPLIFAEEDYRTYPVKHAAYVNLARQIFIENELCLLGFSGDDPNFLEWAGWVRDQLGGKARRIYLVGCLSLRPAKRKFLESLNIAPIDLAPVLGTFEPAHRHAVASELFFNALAASKPDPQHKWIRVPHDKYPLNVSGGDSQNLHERARKDDEFAAEALEKTSQFLESDRKRYPGWLVCPASKRRRIQRVNDEHWIFRPATLEKFDAPKQAKILYEFVWQRKMAFRPLEQKLHEAIAKVLDSADPRVDNYYRREFLVALLRDVRLTHESPTYEQLQAIEERFGVLDDELRLEVAYQRCMLARDRMDHQTLHDELTNLKSDDSIWKLRLSALWSELGHHALSSKLIMEANAALDQSHRLDRGSLWIKSRLGWANRQCQMKDAGYYDSRADAVKVREFKELAIDPSGEIEYFLNSAQEIQAKRYDSSEVMPLFNPGHYRESTRQNNGEVDESSHLNRYELDQLVEFAGLPVRLNHVDFIGSAMVSTAKITYVDTYEWYVFLIRGLHSHIDRPFQKYFNRPAIARLSDEISQQLIVAVRAGITFWVRRRRESQGHERKEDLRFVTDRLRLYLYVLSRLSVRMREDDAVDVFRFALGNAVDPAFNDHWLLEALADLAEQTVSAVSPKRRGDLVITSLLFPLSVESKVSRRFWPNPTAWFWTSTPMRDDGDNRWGIRIGELIAAAGKGQTSRSEAIVRLSYLSIKKALTVDESRAFATVLWSFVDDKEFSLPVDTGLFTSTIVELPAPDGIEKNERASHRIFGRDVRDLLAPKPPVNSRDLEDDRSHMISLRNARGVGMVLSTGRAAELFDQFVNWDEPKIEEHGLVDVMPQHFREMKSLAGEAIAQVILPALGSSAMTEARFESFKDLVSKKLVWNALRGIPYFLLAYPQQIDVVAKAIDKGLASSNQARVANAALAIITWADLAKQGAIPKLPNSLVEKLVFLVAARHEQSMHMLLLAATTLQESALMPEQVQSDLIDALADLFEETKYVTLDIETRKSVSNSLVRAQCVKLARALIDGGRDEQTLNDWLQAAQGDPLPEVRLSLDDGQDIEL